MSTEIYVVKRGDSLSKIARVYGIQPRELAHFNGITSPDVIRIGQQIRIPPREPAQKSDEQSVAAQTEEKRSSLFLQFYDVISRPIEGLNVLIEAGGKIFSHTTSHDGSVPGIDLPLLDLDYSDVVVRVSKAMGDLKEIAAFKAMLGRQHVLLTSPKIGVQSEQRPDRDLPTSGKPPSKAQPAPPGTVNETRTSTGSPVVQTTLECPNPENLRLDRNFKYRSIIIDAGKRSGFMPQAISAIMNAEAATITEVTEIPILGKDKKPIVDKKTGKAKTRTVRRNYGEWDPKSASPASSARGMTQFLDGSWIDLALTDGTQLNVYCKSKKWLTTTKVKNKKGQEKEIPAFRLSDGTLVTAARGRTLANTLSSRPYMVSRATSSDANLQALLDMRFEAKHSIDAAVDYGLQNLAGLKEAGYDLSKLNDGEKAKIVYLCHHLGLADAKRFIQNDIVEKSAEKLLTIQVGAISAKKYADSAGGTYVAGHRAWLNGYENNRIILSKYMCDPTKSPTVRQLTEITDSIKK